MATYTLVLSLFALVMLAHCVSCEESCTSGQYYDRPTRTCKPCSTCIELTSIVCHGDKDSVCRSYIEIFDRIFYTRLQKDDSTAKYTEGKTVKARGEIRDVEIARDDRWQHVTFALTCILCTLGTILVVLSVVACTMYRKSRKEAVLYTIPAYQLGNVEFNIPKYPPTDFTEKVSLVTKMKQEDV